MNIVAPSLNTLNPLTATFQPLKYIGYASIATTYGQAVPLNAQDRGVIVWLSVTNTTSEDVIVSFDGVNDHVIVLANSVFTIPFLAFSRTLSSNTMFLKASVVPTSGSLFVASIT